MSHILAFKAGLRPAVAVTSLELQCLAVGDLFLSIYPSHGRCALGMNNRVACMCVCVCVCVIGIHK